MEKIQTALVDYLQFLAESWYLLIGPIILLLIWMASGSFAATVAEVRRRNPLVHMFLGLCIPVVYPAVIFFVLPVKREKEEETVDDAYTHVDGAPPPEAKGALSLEAVDAMDDDEPEFTKTYFRELATDIEGNPRGPFQFTVEGQELRAERIVDVLPTVVVIEMLNSDNKAQTLRIPFDKIDECIEL